MLIISEGVVAVSVSGCRTWFLCLHGVMRTRSSRAPECGLCGARMKKNGHDRLGRQRWMCPGCRTTGAVRDLSRRRRAEPAEFLGWLFAPSPQPSGSRAFRKRTSWCWGMRPVLELDAAARHVVMADGMTPPAHAETDGTFDGDAPKPGTSIGWTDLHMPVFNT